MCVCSNTCVCTCVHGVQCECALCVSCACVCNISICCKGFNYSFIIHRTRKDIGQQNQHHHQPSEETPLTPRTTSPVSTLRSSSTAQNSGSSDNLGAGGSAQADSGLGSRPMGDGGGRFNGTYRSVPEDDMKGTNRNASSNIHATSDPTLAS